jgi:hypothetical protein
VPAFFHGWGRWLARVDNVLSRDAQFRIEQDLKRLRHCYTCNLHRMDRCPRTGHGSSPCWLNTSHRNKHRRSRPHRDEKGPSYLGMWALCPEGRTMHLPARAAVVECKVHQRSTRRQPTAARVDLEGAGIGSVLSCVAAKLAEVAIASTALPSFFSPLRFGCWRRRWAGSPRSS